MEPERPTVENGLRPVRPLSIMASSRNEVTAMQVDVTIDETCIQPKAIIFTAALTDDVR